jgi:hypothetical protein
LIALLNPFGALLAMRYADRFQRKWQIVALALISAVCGLLWARSLSEIKANFRENWGRVPKSICPWICLAVRYGYG